MAAIAEKPVELGNFIKHCDQRRKYPVLLRVEFQVSNLSYCINVISICKLLSAH